MAYQRILPFPEPSAFPFPELDALAQVWRERKSRLTEDGAYKEFITKLQREWAIETGIIERLYTWDRGVTEVLIEHGIEASIIAHRGGVDQQQAQHISTLIHDHLRIVEGLFAYIKGEECLSEYFIRGLQAQFTEHQDYTEALTESGALIRVALQKGEYKTLPNNPRRPDGHVHVYCPPELTKEEMENLVRMYREAEALEVYSPVVKSAWLHHRFTQIHPFQDGNGRVARALASLVFLREDLFPLVVRNDDRKVYIDALESADAGDLGPLVTLFAKRQKEAILKALGLEQQVLQSQHAEQIMRSALELLRNKFRQEKQAVAVVFEHADKIFQKLENKIQSFASVLSIELHTLTPPTHRGGKKYQAVADAAANGSKKCHYYYKELVETAKQFDYFANLEQYRAWVRLKISTDREFDYVVSVHGYGPGSSGILAVSAFTFLNVPNEEGKLATANVRPAATDLFQLNYAESYQTTEARFEEWLESSLAIALAEWQRTLNT